MLQYIILLTLNIFFDYRYVQLIYGLLNWFFFPNKINWFIFIKSICLFNQGLYIFILCELLSQLLINYDIILHTILLIYPNFINLLNFDKYYEKLLNIKYISYVTTKVTNFDIFLRDTLNKYIPYQKVIDQIEKHCNSTDNGTSRFSLLPKSSHFTSVTFDDNDKINTTQDKWKEISDSYTLNTNINKILESSSSKPNIIFDKNMDNQINELLKNGFNNNNLNEKELEKQIVELLTRELDKSTIVDKKMSNGPNRSLRRQMSKKKN